MKGKVKFLSAAAAALLFASCSSDDLNLGGSANFSGKADLIGSLSNGATRAGMVDGGDDDKAVVWSQGDVINVYSPNVLKYNTYSLNAGSEGTQEGAFTRQGEDNIDIATVGATNCYAVTASENVYGVSATADGKMKLTAKIPQEFQWEEVAYDASNNYYVNPSIFWGKLSAFENDVLKVNFQPLMAMLKVDVALLKTGTKALVLVSKTEPLSGTFNAILEDGGKLAADEQLVNYKAIRINTETLTEDANKVFYIPVIAQKYEEFAVYGIIHDSDDAGFTTGYTDWSGVDRGTLGTDFYEIEDLKNVTFNNGQRRTLARMVEQDLTPNSMYQLSQQIAELMDGVHTVKVKVTAPAFSTANAITAKGKLFGTNTNAVAGNMNSDKVLYIANDIPGDVIITFANSLQGDIEIIEAPTYLDADGNIQFKLPFTSTTTNETLATGESYSYYATTTGNVAVPSAAKARTVTLNLLGTGAATDKNINAYLPTTNLVLGNTAATAAYGATGTPNTGVITAITANTCTIDRDQSAAGLTVKGKIYNVVSDAKNAGGIVIAANVNQLDVQNPAQATSWVKLEDASVAAINYVAQSAETFIYTTGEAAIDALTETTTDKVGVRSYWTGKACQTAAGATIFTAGQLAAIDGSLATYTVSPKVSFIHLGGATYPWVGPDMSTAITAASFTFEGNNRPLQSMKLATKDLTGAAIATSNGLFRNINATGKAVTIQGVDLWDVLADGIECDNVGAIAGNVTATTLTLGAANKPVNVKYVQLSADGDNVGGLFGTATLTGALTTAANITLTGSEVKGTGSNVGGLFGELTTSAAVNLNTNVIKVQNYTNSTKLSIVAGGDNAGGLFGNLNGSAAVDLEDVTVKVDAISAAGANVGGLAGSLTAGAASAIDKVSVAAASGISGLNTVGGLVGISNITGGVTMAAGAAATPISVAADLTATNENVGGLIGNAYVGNVTISNAAADNTSIKVAGALTGAYAVGGMIGISTVTTSITGVGKASKPAGIDLTGVTFANSWAAADFDTPTEKLYCGSFAYLVGYVKGNTTYVSTNAGSGSTLSKGIALPDALNANARKALHFDVNKGNETTAGSTFGFWGQDDMYVGFVNTGVITGLGATLTAGTEYNVYDNVY